MITTRAGTVAVSHLGWVDHSAVWRMNAGATDPETISLGNADWLTLHPFAEDELFAAVHHHRTGDRVEVTLHATAAPNSQLAGIAFDGELQASVTGDLSLWSEAPRFYHCRYQNRFGNGGYSLITVDSSGGRAEIRPMDWFNHGGFDLGYQSISGILLVPGTDTVLVGVQRCSDLFLYDIEQDQIVGEVRLPGHNGNPAPILCRDATRVLAVNYDTVVLLALQTDDGRPRLTISDSLDLGGSKGVGDLTLTEDKSVLVPRPFQGDVVCLSVDDLTQTRNIATERQPLDAALLADGRLIARDWKTGDLLLGIP